RSSPHTCLLIHREAVNGGLAVPDHFVPPVRRWLQWRRISGARRLGIARFQVKFAQRIARRVQNGQIIGTLLERSVDGAVGVHSRISLVARDGIVKKALGMGPAPDSDAGFPPPALRTRRTSRWQLSASNP